MTAIATSPCRGCGGSKPAGQGRKLCDDCRLISIARERRKASDYGRDHYQRNRDAYIVRAREWAEANPERARANGRRIYERERDSGLRLDRRLARYGLTRSQYAALLDAQGGVCAICGGTDTQRCLAVDHDHTTGEVRGLLCSGCNGAKLGRLEDSPERAEARAEYHEARALSLRCAAAYLRHPPARVVLGGDS